MIKKGSGHPHLRMLAPTGGRGEEVPEPEPSARREEEPPRLYLLSSLPCHAQNSPAQS